MGLGLAIEHVCCAISEWDAVGRPWSAWREDQTRYAIIDPIIRALGWNTADPKECFIELPMRDAEGIVGYADYALFVGRNIRDIVDCKVAPSVLIEAKPLRAPLDAHVEQLAWYVATTNMTEGVGVLTNGVEWRLYDVGSLALTCPRLLAIVDITKGRGGAAAGVLRRWLAQRAYQTEAGPLRIHRPRI